MAADQQFCLRWNNHQSTLIQVFDTLLASEQLVDCTLAAEGQYLKAHKVVLSACSPYLELLLAQHYEKHPIVILKDVKFQELKSMMDYMYRGEVNISQDQLSTFLKAAESLQIKGLTDSGEDSRDVGSTKRVDGAAQGARKAAAATGAAAASSGSNRASPAVGGTGLTIEPRPASPHHRDASLSPTPRKRRRARRPSQGDAPDSHNDTSNSCDLPPASALAPPEQHIETEHINNRLQNSNNMELIKEKVEPTPELMIEPKTEYMDENNEDSVEDLTLDDDDDLDMNRSGMDMGRPGPSHGDSNQGFATSWHMQGDRSGTDEVFMAAQEAVGAAHRDSQGGGGRKIKEFLEYLALEPKNAQKLGSPGANPASHKRKLRKRKQLIATGTTKPTAVHKIQHQIKFKTAATSNKNKIATVIRNKIINYKLQAAKKKVKRVKKEPKSAETNDVTNDTKENIGVKVVAVAAFKPKAEKAKLKAALKKSSTPIYKKGEKGFTCDRCGKVYCSRTSLLFHQKNECGRPPRYECPQCSKKFHQKGNMKRHFILIHRGVP